MKLNIVEGKNFKTFVHITDLVTKEDFELYDEIKKVLYRQEYKPFLQTFDKTISYSYLFNEYLFPVTFLDDVLKVVNGLSSKPITVENAHLQLKMPELKREDFDKWVSTLKFPSKYVTDKEEYKYQQDSVYITLKYGVNRIDVATSGGKTFITYLFCRFLIDNVFNDSHPDDFRAVVVTPRKLLVQQLKKDFAEYDEFFTRKIAVESMFSGAKKLYGADIVAGTYQSLKEFDQEYFDDFKAFICDEVHTSKAWSVRNEIYNKMYNVEFFFGMTGSSPEFKTLDYLHVTSMFGPARVVKETHEIIADGIATPVQINIIGIEYKDPDENAFSTNLKAAGIIGTEKLMNEKEFLHNKEERTHLLVKLMKHYDRTSLVFVHTVEYCHILYEYLAAHLHDWEIHIIHGSVTNRDEIIEQARESTHKFLIIATLSTMSTGVSIPSLTYGYLVDGGKSDISIGQAIGRFLRLFKGKTKSIFFDFQDLIPLSSFKNHGNARLAFYKKKKFPYTFTRVKI